MNVNVTLFGTFPGMGQVSMVLGHEEIDLLMAVSQERPSKVTDFMCSIPAPLAMELAKGLMRAAEDALKRVQIPPPTPKPATTPLTAPGSYS